MNQTKSFVVAFDQVGKRLDKFLTDTGEFGSRSQLTKMIEDKLVTVNSLVVKPGYPIREYDLIQVEFREPEAPTVKLLDIKLDILYEDDDLLVVNKPAGLVVHPAAGHKDDTLVNALMAHTQNLSKGNSEGRPGIVHRIDKDTSGALVVAKNDFAHEELSKQFKNRTMHRVYLALTYGRPRMDYKLIESNLGRHPTSRKRFATLKVGGKVALTEYWTIDSKKGVSLLRLKLGTGRTHQIRVHLAELGHPIIADDLYSKPARVLSLPSVELRKVVKGMTRFALHAFELGFEHPVTKKEMFFQSPWPDDLKCISEFCGFEISVEKEYEKGLEKKS